jgi:hypothetical protein
MIVTLIVLESLHTSSISQQMGGKVFFLKKYEFVGPLLESQHDSVMLIVHLYQRHKFQIFQNFPFRHFVRIQINQGTSYNQYVLVVPLFGERLSNVLQTLMKPESLSSRKLESGEAAPAFMLSLIWMERRKLYLRLSLILLLDCLIGRTLPCH